MALFRTPGRESRLEDSLSVARVRFHAKTLDVQFELA